MEEDVKPLSGNEQIDFVNFMLGLKGPLDVVCNYTNWRGEKSERRIRAIGFWYGTTDYHPEPTLLLQAYDYDKREERDFKATDFDLSTLRRI